MISETNQCYFMLLLAVSLCLFIYVLSVHNSIPILYCSVYLHHRPNYAINILFCVIMYILAIPSIVLLPFSAQQPFTLTPNYQYNNQSSFICRQVKSIGKWKTLIEFIHNIEGTDPVLKQFHSFEVREMYIEKDSVEKGHTSFQKNEEFKNL